MTDEPLKLFTMEQVAERLLVSRRWLQDSLKDHPYYRMAGRKKVFTEADIVALYEALPSPASAKPTPVAIRSEASEWTRLQRALAAAEGRRRKDPLKRRTRS